MRVKAYPKYKSSGVEWLGDVPEHWVAQGVKFCYTIQLGKMLQPEPASPSDEESPYLKSQHVQWEHVRVAELPSMWTNKKERRQYAVRDGDLLVCEGGDVGRSAVVRGASDGTIIQNALHRVRPQGENESGFLLYVLAHASSQGWFEIICNKSTIAHFTVEKFGALGVALPKPAEQRSIASFLDRETGRIDTLIAKKRELVERLMEKRTTLISRTVTRGLNPTASLKPSGIDWLGDIPKHWEVKRLKFTINERLQYGANESSEIDDPDLPRYVRITDIDDRGKLRPETFRSLPVEIAREYYLEDGDVLFARSGATSGKTFLYRLEWGTCAYAGYLIRARLDQKKIAPQFLRHFTDSVNYWQWLSSSLIQATIQNVSAEKYSDLALPLPPLSEQIAIAAYLTTETLKLDALVAKVEEAVERLQEYRTALITAAVTGKIAVHQLSNKPKGPSP